MHLKHQSARHTVNAQEVVTTSLNISKCQKSRSGLVKGQASSCAWVSTPVLWPQHWVHSRLGSPEPLHTPEASGRCTVEESEAAGTWVVEAWNGASRQPTTRPSVPRPRDGPAPPHRMAPPPPSPKRARPASSFKAACGKRRECFAPSDAAEVEASPLRRREDFWEGRRDGGGGTGSRLRVRVKRGGSRNLSRTRAGASGRRRSARADTARRGAPGSA